ncbi:MULTISPECIES: polysaccharide lyase 6 family protein [unclassified Streptomyces]|uniref:polysaccharide lyase 6 family protein n=1 Tax=unclassified Streptomyces TaxID=2593676 RepID=UPI0016602D87|nr:MULTISPECIES: polysaccharide lyase 6 family protein [unclassified Streptomyces]MBD0709041.1 lyase precursor [Streptomyces sp. CBMA291]MBD0715387.1 lyase precursor [Streptomyces sp. CBMA370]
MQRRTFLKNSLLGAAVAAVPLPPLLAGGASAAPAAPVTSLEALQSAIDDAVPGDTIVVADGTYTVPSGGAIRVSGRSGTAESPIAIVAQSRGGVVLQGARGFLFENSRHITVGGFAFRQSGTLTIPADSAHIRLTRNDFRFVETTPVDWLVVRGDDTVIDHNHFHDKATEGIFVVLDGPGTTAIAQRTRILRNHFSDHSYSGANGGESIRLGVSSRALSTADALVAENLFERCDGDPEAISVKSSGNTVRHNTIRVSRGGIVLRHGNRTTIDGNYLLGGKDGIRLYGNDHLIVNNHLADLTGRALVVGSGSTRDHTPGETSEERRGNDACDRAVIAHNTLRDNKSAISGETRTYEPRGVVVADNIVVGKTGSLVALGATTDFTWQSNILWGAAANGTLPAGGFTRVDPRLTPGTDGVHRLAADSPAIGAATLTGVPVTEDIDGDLRGTTRDIGADEYSPLPPARRPLTPADVGPDAV